MKSGILFLVLFQLLSLNAQKQQLHGTFKKFNADKTLASISRYDHGQRSGDWVTYYKDTGRQIQVYKKDSLMRHIRINKAGDTIFQIRYFRSLPDYRLSKTYIYKDSILSVKKLHTYKGQDSIVETLDSENIFRVTYDIHTKEIAVNGRENTLIIPANHVLEEQSGEHIYIEVDHKASFKGGQDSFMMFISDNLVYPLAERDNEIEGQVIVSFVVEPDGRISQVKVARSSGNAHLDMEATRIIKVSTHLWVPAKVNGKPVRSACRIPISFELED